ncbi:MAG: hypothetical protein ACYSUQ_04560, partial [Planctomycetota bacterium]
MCAISAAKRCGLLWRHVRWFTAGIGQYEQLKRQPCVGITEATVEILPTRLAEHGSAESVRRRCGGSIIR